MSSPAASSGGNNNNAAIKGVSPSNPPKARPLFSNSSRPSPSPSPSLQTNQTPFSIPVPVRPNPNPSPSSNSTGNSHPISSSRGSGVVYPSATRGGFIPNTKSMEMMEQPQPQPQPHHSFPMNMNMHMMQMNMNLHHHNMIRPPPPPSTSTAAAIRHLSTHPRFPVAPSSSPVSVPDSNGSANDNANAYKNRERDRDCDDALGICLGVVRDRRVRFSDGASLYALCRSWLKNGFPEPDQPPYVDNIKSLPRPLPVQLVDAPKRKGKEAEAELEDVENEKNAGDLSSQELLKRHVRRAKRVRSRLREERLQRIARYKLRLALLLPPQTEQLRGDVAAGT